MKCVLCLILILNLTLICYAGSPQQDLNRFLCNYIRRSCDRCPVIQNSEEMQALTVSLNTACKKELHGHNATVCEAVQYQCTVILNCKRLNCKLFAKQVGSD